MMSNLPASTLGDVWQLADTTKSGSLVFPEFALAMYLCSVALKGQAIPQSLPENIKKEVEKGVDWVAFHVPDSSSKTSAQGVTSSIGKPSASSSTSGFTNTVNSTSAFQPSTMPASQTPQSHPTSQPVLTQQQTGFTPTVQAQLTGYTPTVQAQLTGYTPTIQAQTTGYTPSVQAQTTGYTPTVQAQTTGYTSSVQPQTTGFTPTIQAQGTGYATNLQPQSTGYAPISSQTTGFVPPPIPAQATGYASALQAQPTGRPGEWGFINTPGGGLPGLDKFHSRFIPQPGQQNFTSSGLEGNAKVEWSITKDEKRIYDKIFGEWDKERKGTIGGDIAIKVLSQSGLPQTDLESIWTLSDPGNKGKLDRDEFAVAMHLIYRRLNNYPIPARLPPELIPPSSQNFSDSVSQVKSYLRSSSASNDKSLSSVSYMKNRSFKTSTNQAIKKDATVFKNNDDEMVYQSSARHRSSRNKEKVVENKDKEKSVSNLSLIELRKKVHEKQILLDAIDAKDEEEFDNVQEIEDKNLRAIETLKEKILEVQKEINTYPPLPASSSGGKKDLERTLFSQRTKIPKLVESVRATEDEIAALKLQLFRAEAERANPGSTIVGTGPGGAVTDSDRRKAKNRAMLQARMASLTGKPVPSENSFEEFEAAFAREVEKVNAEKAQAVQAMKDIEESSDQIVRDAESSLRGTTSDSFGAETNPERESHRWVDAIGVEDEVKDFILTLKRLPSYSGPIPTPKTPASSNATPASSAFTASTFARQRSPVSAISAGSTARPVASASPIPRSGTSSPATSLASRTPAERAAYIKAEAKRRMDERMAAMGISRPSASSAKAPSPVVSRTDSRAASTASTPPTPASPAAAPFSFTTATTESVFAPAPIASEPVFAPAAAQSEPTSTAASPFPPPALADTSPSTVADIPSDFTTAPAPISAASDTASESDSDSSSDDDKDDEQFKAMLHQLALKEAKLQQMEDEQATKKALKAAATGN